MSKKEKLCNLITMHKCHVFLTVVEKEIVGSVASKNGGCAGFNCRDFAITKSSWKIY
jgi:hypothetical protein